MVGNEPRSQRNLDGYGAPTIEWARVRDVLDGELTQAPGTGGPGRHTAGLTTSNPDGSPHVMPLGVINVTGTWYFTSGPRTRKSRNLTRDPRCVVSVATDPFDVVVEGTADRVIDADELRTVAAMERLPGRGFDGVRPRHRGALRRQPVRSRPPSSGSLTRFA